MNDKTIKRIKKNVHENIVSDLQGLKENLNSQYSDSTDTLYQKLFDLDGHLYLIKTNKYNKVDRQLHDQLLHAIHVNSYFHIQKSSSFCKNIEEAVKNGADRKLLVYVKYVQNLHTKYFAPLYENGMHGALNMMFHSIYVYLTEPDSIFSTTKKLYQKKLTVMQKEYKHNQTKHKKLVKKARQNKVRQCLNKPKSIRDVLIALQYYSTVIPTAPFHNNDVSDIWCGAHNVINKYSEQKSHTSVRFSRSGYINVCSNGYVIKPENLAASTKKADKSKLYTVKECHQDCVKTYRSLLRTLGTTPKKEDILKYKNVLTVTKSHQRTIQKPKIAQPKKVHSTQQSLF